LVAVAQDLILLELDKMAVQAVVRVDIMKHLHGLQAKEQQDKGTPVHLVDLAAVAAEPVALDKVATEITSMLAPGYMAAAAQD
jgi:hypothetical protein